MGFGIQSRGGAGDRIGGVDLDRPFCPMVEVEQRSRPLLHRHQSLALLTSMVRPRIGSRLFYDGFRDLKDVAERNRCMELSMQGLRVPYPPWGHRHGTVHVVPPRANAGGNPRFGLLDWTTVAPWCGAIPPVVYCWKKGTPSSTFIRPCRNFNIV
jgi:hypothetical protein